MLRWRGPLRDREGRKALRLVSNWLPFEYVPPKSQKFKIGSSSWAVMGC